MHARIDMLAVNIGLPSRIHVRIRECHRRWSIVEEIVDSRKQKDDL
jgi:hypothetical protein